MGWNVTASDAELVEASRRGERAAFGALVERYQRVVCAVGYSATRDHALGEDVAQDTFVAAFHQLAQLRDTSRLREWLCGIARNLARKARRERERETPDDEIESADATTPFDVANERERDTVVAAALARVPEAYREVLVLFYVEQRSASAVASALGISTDAVHQRLSRGRQFVANEVTELVEHTLERRRTRKNLVAGVLGALPVVAPSSHAHAANASNGSGGTDMWKIGIAATLVAAAVGSGYVIHHAHATVAPATAAPAGATPASDPSSSPVAKAFSRTQGRAATSSHAVSPPPALPAVASTGPARYTCADAATRLVATTSAFFASTQVEAPASLDPVKRTIVGLTGSAAPAIVGSADSVSGSGGSADEAMMTNLLTWMCSNKQHWPQRVTDCFATAASLPSAMMCTSLLRGSGAPPTDAEIAAVSDAGCQTVGTRLGALVMPSISAERLAAMGLPADVASGVSAGYDVVRARTPADLTEECNGDGWSDELRRCIVAARSLASAEECR